jgi:hypothetical protein
MLIPNEKNTRQRNLENIMQLQSIAAQDRWVQNVLNRKACPEPFD